MTRRQQPPRAARTTAGIRLVLLAPDAHRGGRATRPSADGRPRQPAASNP